jgi:hypothetical protein
MTELRGTVMADAKRMAMTYLIFELAACLGAALLLAGCEPRVSTPLQHEAYLWQRDWTPGVKAAMRQSGHDLAGWHVLIAESDARGNWQTFSPALSEVPRDAGPLTAVVRLDGTRDVSDAGTLIEHLKRLLAQPAAERWAGLEVDYDCPSRALSQYAAFLQQLKAALPTRMRLSVTALPTWIAAAGLGAVLTAADESVLQVHSVLDPRRGLFDGKRAAAWVADYARKTDRPFRVALPDYGSRVAWDSSGHLLSVISEQPGVQTGVDQEELEARPQDIAAFLRKISLAHARNLVGIIWFRLPVAGDQRIWSLPTLHSVIRGEPLDVQERISVAPDADGAYRIVLTNSGRIDTPLPKTVTAPPCIAADGMADYSVRHDTAQLSFTRREPLMLRAGQKAAIGWTRCLPKEQEILLED